MLVRRRWHIALGIAAWTTVGVGCSLLVDTSGLASGTDAADGASPDGTSDGALDARADANVDGPPYAPLAAGDLRLYYARAVGDLWFRTWSRTSKTWAAPVQIAEASLPRVPSVQPAIAPSGAELVADRLVDNGSATLRISSGQAGWPLAFAVPRTIPASGAARRDFDLAYEGSSSSAMVVYSDGTSTPKFRKSTAGAWSAEQPVFGSAPGSEVSWVKLTSRPRTNEIALLYTDTSQRLYAATWNGDSWSAPSTLEGGSLNNGDFASFTAAYEDMSGDLLAMWSRASTCNGGVDPLYYSVKPQGSTTFGPAATTTNTIGAPGVLVAASEPGTNRIAFSSIEYGTPCCTSSGCNDYGVGVWDGAGWASVVDLDGTVGFVYQERLGTFPVAVGWLGTTGTAVAIYSHQPGSGLSWATWTAGAGWVLQAPARMTPRLDPQVSFAMAAVPGAGAGGADGLALMIEDVNGSVWAKLYDGSTWSDMNGGSAVADNVRANEGMAMGLVVR